MKDNLTNKEKVFKAMEWDIPYHLSELEEITKIEYAGVSKVIDELMKENLIERVPYEIGTYIKFSKKGKMKFQLKYFAEQINYKKECILKLKAEYEEMVKEFKALKDKYNNLEEKDI